MGALRNVIARIKAVITADNRQFKQKMQETSRETQKTAKSVNKSGNLIKAVMGAVITAAAIKLVKNMGRVRMEFEKYEAMLKVALGSQEAATDSMKQLTKFASETPFQLNQLTGAYVKLVNQGFKPTEAQMRSLGDLASAMGKDFDQLTEAIIDAQTGEFERLKEFGIRASKQGDKVTFTFREQEKQVDFTADAIRQYVLGLGDAEGISGSMGEISKTLGGRISNLGDAWDNLMNTLGSKSSGIMVTAINWLIDFTNTVGLAVKGVQALREEVWSDIADNVTNAMTEIQTMKQSLIKGGMEESKAEERAKDMYYKSMQTRIQAQQEYLDSSKGMSEETKRLEEAQLELLKNEVIGVQSKFREIAMLEQKELDAYKATLAEKQKALEEAQAKELEKTKAHYAAYLEAQAKFRTAIASTATAQTMAELETTKMAKAVTNVGIAMDKIPDVGAAAALGVAALGVNMESASYKAARFDQNLQRTFDTIQAEGVNAMHTFVGVFASATNDVEKSRKKALIESLNAARAMIKGMIAEGIAAQVMSALKTVPFPLGLVAGAAAGAAAITLFDQIIPSFAEGGMVTGPTLAMIGDNPSGREAVIPWEKMGDLGGTVELEGVLKGSDIYLSGKRHTNALIRAGRL